MSPQRPAVKRRMSAADRRAQLLDVTRDIVAAEGFAAVSIDRVARAADVTRAVVYQQFADLPGLMDALLERERTIALAGVGSIDRLAPDDDVDAVGRGILAYLHAAPVSWRIILRPPDGAPPDLREQIELGRAYARRVGARHLSRFAGATVDPDGPTARILLAALEELARLHLEDPAAYSDETVLRYLRSLVAWAANIEGTQGV